MAISTSEIERFKRLMKTGKRGRLSAQYGIDRIAKKYLGLPGYIPLSMIAYLEHGIVLQQERLHPKLYKPVEDLLFFDTARRAKMIRYKKAHVLGPLFIHGRRTFNFEPHPEASGTLAFPVHSTHYNTIHFDWKRYAESLLALPEMYHPITACVFWRDIAHGRHKILEDAGIPVVTNGYLSDKDFVLNFYKNICKCKFITGNKITSAAFYAIETGIPFFIYGNDETMLSEDRKYRASVDTHPDVSKAISAFRYEDQDIQSGVKITDEQLELLDFYIDEKSWMAPEEAAKIIRSSFLPILLKKGLSAILPGLAKRLSRHKIQDSDTNHQEWKV